jgi:hypothetical protein
MVNINNILVVAQPARPCLNLQQVELPLIALPIVGSALGVTGRRHCRAPPAHMIAFQASHSSRSPSRVGLTDFCLGSAPDQHRFPIVAFPIVAFVDLVGVSDALRLRLAVATRERNVDDARGHAITFRWHLRVFTSQNRDLCRTGTDVLNGATLRAIL